MNRLKQFVETLYDDHIQQDFDRIIPVVGDEGLGKSTLILQLLWLYDEHRGQDPNPASVLDRVVFDDRDAFREKLLAADQTDPIGLMDASHVLYKKDTMQPDQKAVERSLLDIRIENYVILLGYQDWSDIPDQLQRRRAKNLLYIPKRGYVRGYNRDQLDEKYTSLDKNEWPDPALVDTYPSLEGTAIWDRFRQIDKERKEARLTPDDENHEPEVTPQQVFEQIMADDHTQYVKVNEFQDRAYYDKSLIRFDYPALSDQQADQVKTALAREEAPDVALEGTETQPPA